MMVKICGLRSVDDARLVREHGADLAGLILVPGSKRCLTQADALRIRRALGDVEVVGVFRDATPEVVANAAAALSLDWIQLHGQESLETVERLGARFRVMRALSTAALEASYVEALAPHVAAFLVDGPVPGSGQETDHARIDGAAFLGRPFFVAGGLHAGNVGRIIARARPDGVDVATGVTEGGTIVAHRLAAFIASARGTKERTAS